MVNPRCLLLGVAMALLAACQPRPALRADHALAPAAPGADSLVRLQVRADCRGCLVPSGATLEVLLIVDADSDMPRVIADERFSVPRDLPFDFILRHDPRLVPAGAELAMRASLRDAAGRLRLLTGQRITVDSGAGGIVHLALKRYEPAGP